MRKIIIVFGSTSYLGRYVISALINDGFRVIALSRKPPKAVNIWLEPSDNLEIHTLEDFSLSKENNVEAVVNLAYAKNAPLYRIRNETNSLINSIHKVAIRTSAKRLIHISSQAVFGYVFREVPSPDIAKHTYGDPYIEGKMLAEKLFLRYSNKHDYVLSIIRLGNIIGPGAPGWVAYIAQRILEDKPVSYIGGFGWANATYVKNASNYISFLTKRPDIELKQFGYFHHLAELSSYLWADILSDVSKTIGRSICSTIRTTETEKKQLKERLFSQLKHMQYSRIGGYVMNINRTVLGDKAIRVIEIIKRVHNISERDIISSDQVDNIQLLNILSEKIRFHSHILSSWESPFSFYEAIDDIKSWLISSGYVIEPY